MEFKCSLCEYTSEIKSHVDRHIKNKNKCGNDPKIIEVPVNIFCEYCEKAFATKPNMKRHLKTCKIRKSSLEEEVERLKLENEKLQEKLAQKTNVTINYHSTHNTNNNIIINITPYNDPNLDGAEKYYLQAIKKLFMSIPTIIERIHFNSELPENHNILITNYRTKMAKAWTGTEWKTMDEDQLITELVNTYENLLEDWADGDSDKMKHIEKYKEIKERDGRIKVEKEIREEVKKLIYDKRGMIRIKT